MSRVQEDTRQEAVGRAAALLDEPTSELDPRFAASVVNTIKVLSQRSRVVVSTHSVEGAAELGGDVLVVRGGGVRVLDESSLGTGVHERRRAIADVFSTQEKT